ncbi:sulfotransferase family 2 domain-containing protein [Fictibacillus iocasae]|uniref:Sulfotransferase family 2 domain-containing protein n=1 Tax=Fictibacillus iocasae TaxID=2715437 RepID=A0ABW2NMN0_9BACL
MDKNSALTNHLKWRTPLYDPAFPFILFFSQKGGCTTLIKWFFYQLNLLESSKKVENNIHLYRVNHFYRQPGYVENIETAVMKKSKPVFKLVRNPYARAVSSYLHLSRMNLVYPSSGPLKIEWKKAKNMYPYHDGLTFKQFLYYVKQSGAQVPHVDGHIAGQYVEGEELFMTRFVKLEQLKNQIAAWETQYQLKHSPFAELAKSPHHNQEMMNVTGEFADQVITRYHFVSNQLPSLHSFYDTVTKELVQELFSKEFSLYGYSRQLP